MYSLYKFYILVNLKRFLFMNLCNSMMSSCDHRVNSVYQDYLDILEDKDQRSGELTLILSSSDIY